MERIGTAMSYFPMYVELKDASCLVVGGGNVALRKAETLLEFGAKVYVTAPEIVKELRSNPRVICRLRPFQEADLKDMTLVVAATKDAALNHRISLLCREQKIPVNAVDQKEDCTFIFPSYVKRGEVTAAVTSGGLSPVLTQYLRKRIEERMPENIGIVAEALGEVRSYVKAALPGEEQKKRVYRKLLELGLSGKGLAEQADFASGTCETEGCGPKDCGQKCPGRMKNRFGQEIVDRLIQEVRQETTVINQKNETGEPT